MLRPQGRRTAEPTSSLVVVTRHAATVAVHETEVEWSQHVAPLSGTVELPDSLSFVLGHALTEAVHVAEVELGKDVTLVSRAAEPPDGFLAIPLDTAPALVHDTQGLLPASMAGLLFRAEY